MADPFKPPEETLPPIATLLDEFATIDGAAVEEAVQQWKENPPDPEFENVLEATEAED